MSASSEFIFMYGHVAQPPAVEQPSPPLTPGLRFYMQRTAIQGDRALLDKMF